MTDREATIANIAGRLIEHLLKSGDEEAILHAVQAAEVTVELVESRERKRRASLPTPEVPPPSRRLGE